MLSEWFGRFPTSTEIRRDSYLVAPQLPGLSVKLRGELAVDVKVYRGTPGILYIPRIAQGPLGSWSKWSFPLSAKVQRPDDSLSWCGVEKRRRLSAFLPDDDVMIAPTPVSDSGRLTCTAELTDLVVKGEILLTFAFEAMGPPDRLQAAIEVATARYLNTEVAEQIRLNEDNCRPYSEWLQVLRARR